MARYEGMDDLLQRVRDHVEARPSPDSVIPRASHASSVDTAYQSALELVLLVLHDAEQLRSQLAPDQVRAMSQAQQDDLHSILGHAMRQMEGCAAALQPFLATE